jgi:polyphenol oxidase
MSLLFEYSKASDGNLSYKYEEKEIVDSNREVFLKRLGIKRRGIVALSLLGGTEIVDVDRNDIGKMIEADAAITTVEKLPLFMVVGDCFPVVMWEPVKKILALVHCGRTGIEGHIVDKVIDKLRYLGADMKDITVKIGPGARKESYKFATEDLVQRLNNDDPEWGEWLFEDGNGKTMIDLIGFMKKQLTDAGIKPENIEDCGIDTISDENYFSHYRSRRNGEKEARFGVVTMMR